MNTIPCKAALAAALLCAHAAHAVEIKGDTVNGNFDSTIAVGTGMRLNGPTCDAVIGSAGGTPLGGGCADAASSLNDQGNLNYARHDRFTTYLKGTHELLLNFPDDIKFLGRVSWLRDFSATHASGLASATGAPAPFVPDASDDLRHKARLLDLWVSKAFAIGEERMRVRLGNQVVNWGESLFVAGRHEPDQRGRPDAPGRSQARSSRKRSCRRRCSVWPLAWATASASRPMCSAAGTRNYFPPVGSYWSTATIGKGAPDYGLPNASTPRSNGQYGAALRYQPEGTQLNLGLYAINYHDKSPVLATSMTSGGGLRLTATSKTASCTASAPISRSATGPSAANSVTVRATPSRSIRPRLACRRPRRRPTTARAPAWPAAPAMSRKRNSSGM